MGRVRYGVLSGMLAVAAACGGGGGSSGGGGGGQQPAGQAAPGPQAGGAPGADPYVTSWSGYMSRTFDGELPVCADATKAALRRLELEVTDESGGIFRKKYEAESRDGTGLVVEIAEVTRETTRVSVKVGYLLGDRDAERRILSEIEAEIGKKRQEAKDKAQRWQPFGGGTAAGASSTTLPKTPPMPR